MFSEEFAKLSRADKDEFARVINYLLRKSFVVRDEYDRREKIIKISPTYRFIERYFDLINKYLDYSGWVVEKDFMLGVFSLHNTYQHNRLRFDRETSLILFTLRLIYETEKSEGGHASNAVYLSTPLVLKVMYERGILIPGKRLNGRLIGRSLKELEQHNIINRVSGSWDEGNVNFYLLPSITFAVDNDKIVAISEALEKLALREEREGE